MLEEKLADYLEKWVLQKKGLWWSADWQSGLGQVCPGYGTYVSNSQFPGAGLAFDQRSFQERLPTPGR